MSEPQTLPTGLALAGQDAAAADGAPAALLAAAGARVAQAAGALARGGGLAAALGEIAADAAAALAAHRCAIYLRDPDEGDFVGAAAHEDGGDAQRWITRARIAARTPGLERVVREGLSADLRLAPVDGRRRRSTVELRPSLVVPIPAGGGCGGLLVVDRARAPALPDAAVRELAGAFAALAGAASASARRDESVRRQLHVLGRRLRQERDVSLAEEQLLDVDPTATGPAEIARLLALGLGLPAAIRSGSGEIVAFDADGVATAPPTLLHETVCERREIALALAAVNGADPRILGPYPHVGVGVRHAVARVAGDALVVIAEAGRALRSGDLRLTHRAATVLGVALRSQQRLREAAERERESVVRDAVHGHDTVASLRRRAAAVGLDLPSTAAVCLLSARAGTLDVAEARAAARGVGRIGAAPLASTADGVIALVALAPAQARDEALAALRSELEGVLARLSSPERPVAAVASSACRRLADLPRALAECRALQVSTGPAADGLRCADELGVGRLLLGRLSPAAAQQFVEETFGAIAGQADAGKLLETLDAYFAANRIVRATAARLGIHENTVRHRFRRLASATGLDVLGSADDQLTVRLALGLHHLRATPDTQEPT